jgi:hypothetical protein
MNTKLVSEVQNIFVKAGLAVKAQYLGGDDATDASVDLEGKWQGDGDVGYAIQLAWYSKAPYIANFYDGAGDDFGMMTVGEFKTARAAAAAIVEHIKANNTLANGLVKSVPKTKANLFLQHIGITVFETSKVSADWILGTVEKTSLQNFVKRVGAEATIGDFRFVRENSVLAGAHHFTVYYRGEVNRYSKLGWLSFTEKPVGGAADRSDVEIVSEF